MAAGMGVETGTACAKTVSDTGTGIEPQLVHRLFDSILHHQAAGEEPASASPWSTASSAATAVPLRFRPDPEPALPFPVYLPAIEEIAQPESNPLTAPHGSERVLFVDDEPVLAEMGREMLESLAIGSGQPPTALRRSRFSVPIPDSFDLVITDMTMPGMTGVDLSQKFENQTKYSHHPLHGYSELITEEKAKAIGIQGFAIKPLNFRSITELICQVLN